MWSPRVRLSHSHLEKEGRCVVLQARRSRGKQKRANGEGASRRGDIAPIFPTSPLITHTRPARAKRARAHPRPHTPHHPLSHPLSHNVRQRGGAIPGFPPPRCVPLSFHAPLLHAPRWPAKPMLRALTLLTATLVASAARPRAEPSHCDALGPRKDCGEWAERWRREKGGVEKGGVRPFPFLPPRPWRMLRRALCSLSPGSARTGAARWPTSSGRGATLHMAGARETAAGVRCRPAVAEGKGAAARARAPHPAQSTLFPDPPPRPSPY